MELSQIVQFIVVVCAGFAGALLYTIFRSARGPDIPLPELPPEIRAQISGCRNCNLSEKVCSEHPRKPFEACGCGAMPTPCPVCRSSSYDLLELLEHIAALKARTW